MYYKNMMWNVLLQLIAGCILFYIAINDFKTNKITNRSLLMLLTVGLGATWKQISITERVMGVLLSGAPLLIISMIKPKTFGGGDIKLASVAGGILGYVHGLMSLGIGFLTGGIYSAILLISDRAKKGSDKFAFGPFICIGIVYCIYFVNS